MENLYMKRNGGMYGPTELNEEYTKKILEVVAPIYSEMLLKHLSPIEAEFLIHSVATDLRLNTLCGLDQK